MTKLVKKSLPNSKSPIQQNCPYTFKFLPKWRTFAQSGHTERKGKGVENVDLPRILLVFLCLSVSRDRCETDFTEFCFSRNEWSWGAVQPNG